MATNNATNTSVPVPVASGGTGLATITANSVMVGEGTSAITPIAVGANNSVLVGNTGADPGFTTSGTLYATGISFDSGSNTLSNYAVGTWTPTIDGATPGATTYTTQNGYYTRIGNIAIVSAYIVISAATGTGNATLGGLPFTIKNQTQGQPIGAVGFDASGWTWPAGTTSLNATGAINTTTATINVSGSAAALARLQMTNAAATIYWSMFYQI